MFFCYSMHLHHRCWVLNSFCWKRTEGFTILHKTTMPSFLAGTRNLMFTGCKMRFKLSPTLCRHLDKIPGPGQEWRCRGLCAIALWMYPLLFCSSRIRCKALQIFCMMDRWMRGRKLDYVRTDKWTSSVFLCSFVLVSKTVWRGLKHRYDSINFFCKKKYYVG